MLANLLPYLGLAIGAAVAFAIADELRWAARRQAISADFDRYRSAVSS